MVIHPVLAFLTRRVNRFAPRARSLWYRPSPHLVTMENGMPTLSDAFTGDDAKKAAVVEDCCTLIDEEVASRGGISGLALKAGYGAIKGVKPGFVKGVVADLLPEFAAALEAIYQEARQSTRGVASHLEANAGRVADALLGITDEKAARSKNNLVKSTYDKLRSGAKKNVEQAVPRLAKLVEKHVA